MKYMLEDAFIPIVKKEVQHIIEVYRSNRLTVVRVGLCFTRHSDTVSRYITRRSPEMLLVVALKPGTVRT